MQVLKLLNRIIKPKIRSAAGQNGSSIPDDIIREYREFAGIRAGDPICKAPFIAMRLNRSGGVTPCCQNYLLDQLEGKSLMEVWNGEAFQNLRRKILQHDLDGHCDFCKALLMQRNYGSVLAANYNAFDIPYHPYPTYLDLSIDNRCNLSCVMCNSSLSSGHASADHPGRQQDIYDADFFSQLEEIIPHLSYAIFSGGEPFLIDAYYRIWERISELNPDLDMTVTTNATIMNGRVKKVLERGRFSFNVSIDSLEPEIYEEIRRNASWEQTHANLKYLMEYSARHGRTLTLVACPMRRNWRGLHRMTDYCNQNGLRISFNLVSKPFREALWPMEREELDLIAAHLAEPLPASRNPHDAYNRLQLHSLLMLVRQWARHADIFHSHGRDHMITRSAFRKALWDHILSGSHMAADPKERALTESRLDEVCAVLPETFITDFFVDQLRTISPGKIAGELIREEVPTTADNLCSVFYYARELFCTKYDTSR